MTVCLNPVCPHPANPDQAFYCQACGSPLYLDDRYRAIRLIGQGGFGRTFLAVDQGLDQGLDLALDRSSGSSLGQSSDQNPDQSCDPSPDPSLAQSLSSDQDSVSDRALAHSADPVLKSAAFETGQLRASQLRAGQLRAGQPSSHSNLDRTHSKPYCVIKQLLPRTDAIDRFQLEVDRLAQLGQHPQIPRLLAASTTPIGQFLVQEWIDGDNLETRLAAAGCFSEVQVRQLLADILPVLRFVHQHQVIHRDLKPANLIWQQQTQRYVLVDFGSAKTIRPSTEVDSPAGSAQPGLTQTGTTIGSAGYVAPEQAMGKATFASDLYSLGVTCIHLLTGLHPFDLYSVSDDRWVWRQYLTQPVSLELRKVLDTLLQRATNQRYATATEVLQALRLEPAPAYSARSSAQPLPDSAPQPTAVSSRSPSPPQSGLPLQSPTHFNPLPSIEPAADRPDPEDWYCHHTIVAHQSEVSALAVSADGQLLASGGADKTIQVWHLDSGELLYRWTGRTFLSPVGHEDRITALTFSPHNRVLISASTDGTIQQWDLQTGDRFSNLPGQGWGIAALALSPHEPLLASGGTDGLIQLWDLEAETLITNLVQLAQPITALQIDPAGRSLWSSGGKPICQWDLRTDRLITTLKGHVTGVTAIALAPQHCTLISSGTDRLIKLWNLNTQQQQKLIAAHKTRIQALAVHPHQPCFASASEDGSIKLWNLWTGDRLTTLRHAWGINAIQFVASKNWLISGSVDGTLQFWQPGRENTEASMSMKRTGG
ncbi:MAG: serine/threonine protein kinase [Elainella sp. Prado103]|nr:serine/threonine protein kinase [Elainella sp. Prado103]